MGIAGKARRFAILGAAAVGASIVVLAMCSRRVETPAPAADAPPQALPAAPAGDAPPLPLGPEQLEGQVVDLAGKGVPGLRVLATPEGQASAGRPADSDAEGRFLVRDLPQGSYRVRVEGAQI